MSALQSNPNTLPSQLLAPGGRVGGSARITKSPSGGKSGARSGSKNKKKGASAEDVDQQAAREETKQAGPAQEAFH